MKKFTFCLDNSGLNVKVGDKLPMTIAGKAPGMLIYGIKDDNVDLLNEGPTLCSDPNDQNYLADEVLETMPEDITATVRAVEYIFGLPEITISIDELESAETV